MSRTAEAAPWLVLALLWLLVLGYLAIGLRYEAALPPWPYLAITCVILVAAGTVVAAVQGNASGFVVRLFAVLVLVSIFVRVWLKSC